MDFVLFYSDSTSQGLAWPSNLTFGNLKRENEATMNFFRGINYFKKYVFSKGRVELSNGLSGLKYH